MDRDLLERLTIVDLATITSTIEDSVRFCLEIGIFKADRLFTCGYIMKPKVNLSRNSSYALRCTKKIARKK